MDPPPGWRGSAELGPLRSQHFAGHPAAAVAVAAAAVPGALPAAGPVPVPAPARKHCVRSSAPESRTAGAVLTGSAHKRRCRVSRGSALNPLLGFLEHQHIRYCFHVKVRASKVCRGRSDTYVSLGLRVSLTQHVLQSALIWRSVRSSCIVRHAMSDVLGGHVLQQRRRSESWGKASVTLTEGLHRQPACFCPRDHVVLKEAYIFAHASGSEEPSGLY